MKKKFKQAISRLIPNGLIKSQLKNWWYNFLSSSHVKFHLHGWHYKTSYQDMTIFSIDPLYHIVPDFAYYTHFYQIKPEDVIIDAGANRGYIALFFAQLASAGTVYAFEPDKYNLSIIDQHKNLNPSVTNIETTNLLLWDKNCTIDFCESGSVASSAHWLPVASQVVKKDAVSLDNWVEENQIKRLDFIKMDIEGAELEAIVGCEAIIKRFAPNFAIASYHIIHGEPTYIKLEQFFKSIGYPYKTVKFKSSEIITFAGPGIV